MSRTHLFPKDTGISTFYNTHHSETAPFSLRRRAVDGNGELMEGMAIDVQGKMEKLKERVALDQRKVERNYVQLQQLRVQMEQESQRMVNDREMDSIVRGKKDVVRQVFEECRIKTTEINKKGVEQLSYIKDSLNIYDRDLQREKEQRGGSIMKIIDQFETEMLQMQKQLKLIRSSQQEVFEQIQVSIYNLQQKFNSIFESEQSTRKLEHETMIKLVGECIQNFSYIY